MRPLPDSGALAPMGCSSWHFYPSHVTHRDNSAAHCRLESHDAICMASIAAVSCVFVLTNHLAIWLSLSTDSWPYFSQSRLSLTLTSAERSLFRVTRRTVQVVDRNKSATRYLCCKCRYVFWGSKTTMHKHLQQVARECNRGITCVVFLDALGVCLHCRVCFYLSLR